MAACALQIPGRLRRRAEFVLMTQQARKIALPGLVMQVSRRGDDLPVRLGFTVTKKIGNAVVRNRTRRRLREAARLVLAEAPGMTGYDVVLVGRATTRTRRFTALQADIVHGFTRGTAP